MVHSQLPVRTFLDRSIVALFSEHGEWIVEGQAPVEGGAAFSNEELSDLNALRSIFAVNERAGFQFITAEASIAPRASDADVFWPTQLSVISDELLATDGPTSESRARSQLLDAATYDWIEQANRIAVRYALLTRCDAYMTTDRELVTQASAFSDSIGLRFFTPVGYWGLLQPWARLWV